jgi:hypothetical protein
MSPDTTHYQYALPLGEAAEGGAGCAGGHQVGAQASAPAAALRALIIAAAAECEGTEPEAAEGDHE